MNDAEFKRLSESSIRDVYYEKQDAKGCERLESLAELNRVVIDHPVRSRAKSTDTTPKSTYELHLLDMSTKDLRFVANVLGSLQKAKDFRDGVVTLTDLGLTSPVERPKRLSEI